MGAVVLTFFISNEADTEIGAAFRVGAGLPISVTTGFSSSNEGDRERASAIKASVFDLRDVRLASGGSEWRADVSAADLFSPGFSMGTVPSTAIESDEVNLEACLSSALPETYEK